MKPKHFFPVALTVLVVIYAWSIVNRGIGLVRSGSAAGMAMGIAVFVIPALVIALLSLEWRLALAVDAMGAELARRDDLPFAKLPAGLSGEAQQARVQADFATLREAIAAQPDNFRSWYHVAFVYNAMGDRRNARMALREAAKRWRARTKAPARSANKFNQQS